MSHHNHNKRRLPRLAIGLLLIASLTVTGACGKKQADSQAPDQGEIVASYKGGQVSKAELDSFINTTNFFYPQFAYAGDSPEFKEYMLKQLVTLNILSERASADSKKEAETKSKEQIKQVEDYFKSQGADALDKQLKELNITKQDIESYVLRNFTVMTDLDKKVTDQQVKDSYDQRLKENPHAFDIASVSHILVALKDPNDPTGQKELRTKEEALKRAQEAKQKLDQGGDFAALAKEYSDDPGSKDEGGKYENENLGTTMWDPAFKKAAEEQPVGQIGEPFETSFGYHIMRVDKRETEKLENVKDSLKSELSEKIMQDFVTNELPKLEFKTNLPAPSASPAATAPGASGQPVAPAASPAGN